MESWGAVFRDLVERGLSGVRYVVSDEHLGLVQALQRYFPAAAHQRCTVHYQRNALAYVSTPERRDALMTALRDVWAAPCVEEARSRLQRLIDSSRKPLPKLAAWLEESAHDTLAFMMLKNRSHRRLLKTTNGVEHDHAKVRRRSRVVRIFPNEAALIGLLATLAIERNEQWLERRYLIADESTESEDVTQAA